MVVWIFHNFWAFPYEYLKNRAYDLGNQDEMYDCNRLRILEEFAACVICCMFDFIFFFIFWTFTIWVKNLSFAHALRNSAPTSGYYALSHYLCKCFLQKFKVSIPIRRYQHVLPVNLALVWILFRAFYPFENAFSMEDVQAFS